jgi:hypothetical protein
MSTLADALTSIKTAVSDDRPSDGAHRFVEDTVLHILEETRGLQAFSPEDFLHLLQISILGAAYINHNISDLPLLNTLSDVVPSSFGIHLVYPSLSSEGAPSLWYYDEVLQALPHIPRTESSDPIYRLLRAFGEYSLRISGLFPDLIAPKDRVGGPLAADRKTFDGVTYFEQFGQMALSSAGRRPIVQGTVIGENLEYIAGRFSFFRQLLNEAGAMVGTSAKQRFVEDLMAASLTISPDARIGKMGFLSIGEERFAKSVELGVVSPYAVSVPDAPGHPSLN